MSRKNTPTAPELEEPLLRREPYLEQATATTTAGAPVAQQVVRIRVQEAEVLVEHVPPIVANAVVAPPVSGDSALQGQGRWKDSLCNCCAYGCCHPSLICAWCCPLIAIAQVMRRLNLLIHGKQGSNFQSRLTFFTIFVLSVAFHYLSRYLLDAAQSPSSSSSSSSYLDEYPWVVSVIPFSFSFCLFYLIVMTRRYIREKYGIPERNCVGCEDCCVAVCFPCCTISQMARHTTDYDLYRPAWCSDTGLPGGVPSIV